MMERMKTRQIRRSLSREASVASNLSDLLMSPCSSHVRLPFKREDSVCSNLSDFTVSECSELSMDNSVKEEVNNTFKYLEEIEQDLDDLKNSVLQMDEEVAVFVTKPDPYSLKMTYSDYSISSRDDPDSLPPILESPPLSPGQQNIARAVLDRSNKSSLELKLSTADVGHVSEDTEAEDSLEWDSPRHGWSSLLPVAACHAATSATCTPVTQVPLQ